MVRYRNPGTQVFDDTEHESVNTEEAQANSETFIRFNRNSISSSTSANTFINPYDTTTKDNRGEADASQQFSPDKDGEYHLEFSAGIADSTEGDTGKFEVIRDSVRLVEDELRITGNNNAISGSCVIFLNSSESYQIQVTNVDSSFRVITNSAKTYATVRRSVVQ
jgi:hypothetical protein